ncbi:MAG TPA: hypothetical protein VIL61_09280, partial [Nitrospiria bacterium]
MKTSRHVAAFVVIGGGLIVAAASALGGTIVGSRHDLSALNVRGYGSETGPMTGGSFNDYRETCVYCHTPHNAGTTAPLWNRELPSPLGYEMYSSPNFDSPSTANKAPDGISLGCLSCHDGSVAVDAVLNKPKFHDWFDAGVHYRMSPEGGVGTDSCGKCHNRERGAYGALSGAHDATIRYLTKNLRDDHPISVPYPTF